MQIDRLFEIVYILLGSKSATAKELAAHFGVSRRTICRDIDTLSAAGIPIYTERGRGGGIRLLPDFVLNKSILSEQEQNEILLALQSLSNVKTEGTEQISQKLSAVFGKSAANWLEVDFSGQGLEQDYWRELKTAILDTRIVCFDYYNSHGDKGARRVEPMQLWFKDKAWYLKGFCLDKQAMRLYRLSRIKNLVLASERFSLRDTPAITGNPIYATCDEQQIIALKLHIRPEKAYRVFDDFYESMVQKQADGSFIVSVSWPEDNWLYGLILSYGKHAEVLEPPHLRKIIKNEAQNMLKNYL